MPGSICTPIGANVPKGSKPAPLGMELLLAPTTPLIVRVKFRNQTVKEVLGSESQCEELFDKDDQRLIDYVQTLNPHTLEFMIWHHEDDLRWEGIEL